MMDGRKNRLRRRNGSRALWFVVVALSLMTPVIVAACGGSSQFEASDVYEFQSLPELVATVDLIAVGNVEATGYRTVGPKGEEVRYLEVSLRVDKVLRGSTERTVLPVDSLELEDFRLDWRSEGAHIVAFLMEDPSSGVYFPASSQTVFVLDGDDVRATSSDDFADSVAGLSLAELEAGISSANERISRGEVAPAKPIWER